MTNSDTHNCIWVGIGLDIHPNEPEYRQIVTLSNQLNDGDYFDPVSNPPHVNLYDFDLPKADLSMLEEALDAIATKHSQQELNVNGVNYFPFGTIFIDLKATEELGALEEDVVRNCSPLRGDCRTEDYWQPWRYYTPEQITNREKYGNPHVMSTFVPHLTIGFLKTREEQLKAKCKSLQSQLHLNEMNFGHLDLIAKTEDGEVITKKSFKFTK